MSNTVVKPQRVSISCMCCSSFSAGAFAAPLHASSVKCTWLFQNPAVITLPLQSMTWAAFGTWT